MAPSETSILSNFLLTAASFSSAMTFEEFADLFPDDQQNSREVEQLYRELQHQRAIDTDDVKHNIEAEVKRAQKMEREIARARMADEAGHEVDGVDARETAMEIELFGNYSNAPKKPYSLRTIQPAMTTACQDLREEIAELEAEANALLGGAKGTISGLNDLKYGRFSQSSSDGRPLGQEAHESLRILQNACANVRTKT
ncbi:MAG: hypothetical protein M1820_004503 [Bogoriella megaspora]|nr:MAG: hypothetical protein M1820_004503 [Bogoriella megaspora]